MRGKTDICFSICASVFSHFYKPAVKISTSHIMTLYRFPSSSLLTPAVSCWYSVAMFGIWTQWWWFFIRVEQIDCCFHLPLSQDCSLRQSETQNGFSCLSTAIKPVEVVQPEQLFYMWLFYCCFLHSVCWDVLCLIQVFFSPHLPTLFLFLSTHSVLLHSGSPSRCSSGQCLWPCLHCVSLCVDLLPA